MAACRSHGLDVAKEWVSGVEREQDYANVMDRLAEWGRQQEEEPDLLSLPSMRDYEY